MQVEYSPAAAQFSRDYAENFIELIGLELTKFKLGQLSAHINSLAKAQSNGNVFEKDENGLEIYISQCDEFVIFFQRYKTHLYVLEISFNNPMSGV